MELLREGLKARPRTRCAHCEQEQSILELQQPRVRGELIPKVLAGWRVRTRLSPTEKRAGPRRSTRWRASRWSGARASGTPPAPRRAALRRGRSRRRRPPARSAPRLRRPAPASRPDGPRPPVRSPRTRPRRTPANAGLWGRCRLGGSATRALGASRRRFAAIPSAAAAAPVAGGGTAPAPRPVRSRRRGSTVLRRRVPSAARMARPAAAGSMWTPP